MNAAAHVSTLAAAVALAACSAPVDQLDLPRHPGTEDPSAAGEAAPVSPATAAPAKGPSADGGRASAPPPPSGTPAPPQTGGGSTPTPTPGVNNATAKQYFFSDVHTGLQPTCGACHGDAGPGPAWFFADKDKTYITFENLGYISKQSRVLIKGAHGAAPALTPAQSTTVNAWIDKELASRGNVAPTSIKEKLGSCFDEAKFNAIGVQNLKVTQRNGENADTCTGCRNNTPCMKCHTSDAATGVILAATNANVPANYTFQKAKELPFIDLFIGTNGTEVVGSKKLQLKAEATGKDKPYTHPLFTTPATMQASIDAFALDVATKYKAGQCK